MQDIRVISLLKLEILREWRNKYALAGLLTYVFSCVLVVKFLIQYSSGKSISAESEVALFWLIMLFSTVNAIANAFNQEPEGRKYYYMWVVKPAEVITSKLLYNLVLSALLTCIAFLTFYIMIGLALQNIWLFFVTCLIGGSGYAFIFTMVGAVASSSKNNASLIAVLGMPLVIPLLIFISKLSIASIDGATGNEVTKNILLLFSLDAIIAALAYLLYPYLWRD